jgi:hypothetical protein
MVEKEKKQVKGFSEFLNSTELHNYPQKFSYFYELNMLINPRT